ncbi:MAG: Hpt domain-containing protein [Bacteroidales bacterium]|nr:Hpt domain-containing protein [Bacteroidales bacterium]
MDFQDKFIEEAHELIYGLESQLISLESNLQDKVAIDEIFRVMHTLKGAASMFGFDKIEQITHNLESIYDSIRDYEIEVTTEIINLTFSTIDIIKTILGKKNVLNNSEQKIFNETLHKINLLMGEESGGKENELVSKQNKNNTQSFKAFYILYTPDEDIYFRGIKPLSVFFELTDLGKYKAIPYTNKTPSPQNFNPDKFFLYWDIFFMAECNKSDVEDIFMFFQDEEYFISEIDINSTLTSLNC